MTTRQEESVGPAPDAGRELPVVALWLEGARAAEVEGLLSRDQALTHRLVRVQGQSLPPRCLVVVDRTTVEAALAPGGELRSRRLPLVVLLDGVAVSTLSSLLRRKYLNIRGFFRGNRIAADLVELGRLAQVLREELGLMESRESEPGGFLRLGEMIEREAQVPLTEVTSLFVDAKMRRFIHELGQILEGVETSGLKDAGRRFGESATDLQGLFAAIGFHLTRNRRPSEDPKSRGGTQARGAQAGGASQSLESFLASQPVIRNTLKAIQVQPGQPTDLPRQHPHILMQGETGTGKTLIAAWIREHLDVTVFKHLNVSALPPTLLESELFGSVSGGYTDAVDRTGLLLEAYGGVVFLDEIGDLPLELQSKLLVYLDSYTFRPVGWPPGLGEVAAPCFVVAATNRPLEARIKAGQFREDLYHRFLYKLYVPPLRERKGDLPLLVDLVLQDGRINRSQRIQGISHRALRILESYPFKGNYRELEHILGRSCALADQERGVVLQEKHLYRAILEIGGLLE